MLASSSSDVIFFDMEFKIKIIPRVIALAVTIPAAFIWHSYWALVGGIVATRLMTVGLSYMMHPYRPFRRGRDEAHLRILLLGVGHRLAQPCGRPGGYLDYRPPAWGRGGRGLQRGRRDRVSAEQ